MTTHTPGPWRAGDAGHTVFGPPNGEPSPQTIAGNVRIGADARLVAAAPELLAALEAFVLQRDKLAGFPLAVAPYSGAYVAARAAIAKAKGEA